MKLEIEEFNSQIQRVEFSETAIAADLTAEELMSVSGGLMPIGLITIEI